MAKRRILLFTGNGKGKTSAAIGIAVRAAGAGMKVYIQQFAKGKPTSEIKALRGIANITVERCGRPCFADNENICQ